MSTVDPGSIDALVRGEVHDPHSILGTHPAPGGKIVRAWRPDAAAVRCIIDGKVAAKLEQVHPAGLFEGLVDEDFEHYQLETDYPDGNSYTVNDPYAFLPTLGDLDIHLVSEGRHRRLFEKLGAR